MPDLEQLSREAAEILDEKARRAFGVTEQGMIAAGMCGSTQWLHESTEACAEIMVWVLWARGIWLERANMLGRNEEVTIMPLDVENVPYCDDPMQAFRTAVLRALIEVKK